MDDVEISNEDAILIYAAYRNWFEELDARFDRGLTEAPDEDDRLAYEFATGLRRDLYPRACRISSHAAIALEVGVSQYLDDIGSGAADATYFPYDLSATRAALADLQRKVEDNQGSYAV